MAGVNQQSQSLNQRLALNLSLKRCDEIYDYKAKLVHNTERFRSGGEVTRPLWELVKDSHLAYLGVTEAQLKHMVAQERGPSAYTHRQSTHDNSISDRDSPTRDDDDDVDGSGSDNDIEETQYGSSAYQLHISNSAINDTTNTILDRFWEDSVDEDQDKDLADDLELQTGNLDATESERHQSSTSTRSVQDLQQFQDHITEQHLEPAGKAVKMDSVDADCDTHLERCYEPWQVEGLFLSRLALERLDRQVWEANRFIEIVQARQRILAESNRDREGENAPVTYQKRVIRPSRLRCDALQTGV
ncbi:hypothetical protein SCUP515_11821 [Seiridium cupressi]